MYAWHLLDSRRRGLLADADADAEKSFHDFKW